MPKVKRYVGWPKQSESEAKCDKSSSIVKQQKEILQKPIVSPKEPCISQSELEEGDKHKENEPLIKEKPVLNNSNNLPSSSTKSSQPNLMSFDISQNDERNIGKNKEILPPVSTTQSNIENMT